MKENFRHTLCTTNITAPFNIHADSKFQTSTYKCAFRYSQLNARGNQIVEHSSDNETVLGSSRKLGGAAEHLIEGYEKRICRLKSEI